MLKQFIRLSIFMSIWIAATGSSFAQRISETDLGPMVAVDRQFQIQLVDCEKRWVVSPFFAQCIVDMGEPRIARLLTTMPAVATWQYDSGNGWLLDAKISRTSQGYAISLTGDQKMPADRLTWSVAEKYILKTLEKIKTPTITATYVRPANDVRSDEVLLGPIAVFDRVVHLAPGAHLLRSCEGKLKNISGRTVCELNFMNKMRREVSLNTQIIEHKLRRFEGDSFVIQMNSTMGWVGGNPYSTAFLRLEYVGELKDYLDFKKLYAATVSENKLESFHYLLHRIGNKPLKTSWYSERALGPARLVVREFDFDQEKCLHNWQVNLGRGSCRIQIPLRGIPMPESAFLYQAEVQLDAEVRVQMNVTVDPSGYHIDAYGKDVVLYNSMQMRRAFEELMKTVPSGLFRDLALVYPLN